MKSYGFTDVQRLLENAGKNGSFLAGLRTALRREYAELQREFEDYVRSSNRALESNHEFPAIQRHACTGPSANAIGLVSAPSVPQSWTNSFESDYRPNAFLARREGFDDRLDIENTTTPGSSAGILKGCPEPRIVGDLRIWKQVGSRGSRCQYPGPFLRTKRLSSMTYQIDAPFQLVAIDDNLNNVSVNHC